jgi:hypothetical protein
MVRKLTKKVQRRRPLNKRITKNRVRKQKGGIETYNGFDSVNKNTVFSGFDEINFEKIEADSIKELHDLSLQNRLNLETFKNKLDEYKRFKDAQSDSLKSETSEEKSLITKKIDTIKIQIVEINKMIKYLREQFGI